MKVINLFKKAIKKISFPFIRFAWQIIYHSKYMRNISKKIIHRLPRLEQICLNAVNRQDIENKSISSPFFEVKEKNENKQYYYEQDKKEYDNNIVLSNFIDNNGEVYNHIVSNIQRQFIVSKNTRNVKNIYGKKLKNTCIHQFHSGSAYGDAVTNSLLYTQKLLRSLGYKSEIYCEHIAVELGNKIKHYTKFNDTEDSILLLHHSMGHDLDNWVLSLKCRIILVYHNITPYYFFQENSPFYIYSKKGIQQLVDYKEKFITSIAVSEYNKNNLLALGYDNVSVIPLLFDKESILSRQCDMDIVIDEGHIKNILFVGRIAPNKKQEDLLKIIPLMRQIYPYKFRFVFIGGYDINDKYYKELQSYIDENGIEDYVLFTGKIEDDKVISWYRISSLYVSMSEHEGFGVPLIEAMIFKIPVIAYNAGAIKYTLSNAGIIINEKNFQAIAVLLCNILDNRELKRYIISEQLKRIDEFSYINIITKLYDFLECNNFTNSSTYSYFNDIKRDILKLNNLKYQIEGPFESSYSLAMVNRNTALSLNKYNQNSVALFPTEGPGDYNINEVELNKFPEVKILYKNSKKYSSADVVIRNLYPPRVVDMDGMINILNFGWEESGINNEWIDNFNNKLDCIIAMSRYVKKILIDNGYRNPIYTCGLGVEHILKYSSEKIEKLEKNNQFIFLHISSAFPRKGVDVLLEAYARAFKKDDNTLLIIKSFPNPHNTVDKDIEKIKTKYQNIANIIHINKDISDSQVKYLYEISDAFVAPTRGEGFGLPMAEAMLMKVPVITTGYGGQNDFCNIETSWLIDYSFSEAKTHLGIVNSMWIEPDIESVSEKMLEVYRSSEREKQKKVMKAYDLITNEYTWDNVGKCINSYVTKIKSRKINLKPIKVGWISTWDVKCGIATYSSFLLNYFHAYDFDITILSSKDSQLLHQSRLKNIRCWNNYNHDCMELLSTIIEHNFEIIVIQYNFGFFTPKSLGNIIQHAKKNNIKIIVEFHSVKNIDKEDYKASLSEIIDEMKLIDRVLVHNIDDVNYLKMFSIIDNVALFPLGVVNYTPKSTTLLRNKHNIPKDDLVIATYGFLLPHKGIEELIESFYILQKDIKNLRLLLINSIYHADISQEVYSKCEFLIHKYDIQDKVIFITDYLADEESLEYLGCADIISFSYQNTQESASGAVKYGIASCKPVICTPLDIFSDMNTCVHYYEGTSIEDITKGLYELLTNNEKLVSKHEDQLKWINLHQYSLLSRRLQNMLYYFTRSDYRTK